MTTDRIKEIQEKTAYPESVSVQQALLQVWNECELEKQPVKNCLIADVGETLRTHYAPSGEWGGEKTNCGRYFTCDIKHTDMQHKVTCKYCLSNL